MNKLVKMAVDSYHGKTAERYSISDNMVVLRKALVEANNGSTKLDFKAIRDGKCNGLFALIEEILTKTVVEGLPETSPIFNYVDYKPVDVGDKASFYVPDNSLLTVADIANGTQGIRRQKVEFGKSETINTQTKAIKIYADLDLVLSGKIDFNEFIDRASKSFQTQINNDIVSVFLGTYDKAVAPYKQSGAFSDNTLLSIIDHVEAATGLQAKILGSRLAIRKITTKFDADEAKNDIYNIGYQGKYYGTPVFALKNGHKNGSTEFILNDTDLYVVAGDDKFIKFVTEGDMLMIAGDPTSTADLTQEFTIIQKYGVGMALSQAFGVYKLSA